MMGRWFIMALLLLAPSLSYSQGLQAARVPYSSNNVNLPMQGAYGNNINAPYVPSYGQQVGLNQSYAGSYSGSSYGMSSAFGNYGTTSGYATSGLSNSNNSSLSLLLFNDFMFGNASFSSRLMKFAFFYGLSKTLAKSHSGASQLIMLALLGNLRQTTTANQPRGMQDEANPCVNQQLSSPTAATSGYTRMLQGLLY